jgi:ribosome-associated protein
MIIASGTSSRHVSSLASRVVETLKSAGFGHVAVEGQETSDWVLVDAGDIIVHLFRPEARRYYNLEKMWSVGAPQLEAVL